MSKTWKQQADIPHTLKHNVTFAYITKMQMNSTRIIGCRRHKHTDDTCCIRILLLIWIYIIDLCNFIAIKMPTIFCWNDKSVTKNSALHRKSIAFGNNDGIDTSCEIIQLADKKHINL